MTGFEDTAKQGEIDMMKRMVLGAVTIWAVCFVGNGYADRRGYVWTYEYSTMPAGILEGEYYLTLKVPDSDARETSVWQHQVELEYGLTDDLDVGLYQVFEQSRGPGGASEFSYEGFKARGRYKLLKKDAFLVDPLLYVEYIRESDLDEPDEVEAKLVMSRDLGRWNVAYNVIVERELESDAEWVHEFAAGVRYVMESGLSYGVEGKGSYTEDEYAAGPVVSMETESLWVVLGSAIGLNEETEDIQVRLIAGHAF